MENDTETLFNLILHFGLKKQFQRLMEEHFSYFDQIKKEVFIVRDRVGEKPLYYSINNNYFMFSSEIKSIFLSNLNDFSPNVKMFRQIFLHGKILNETAFKRYFSYTITFLKYKLKDKSYEIYEYWNLEDFDTLKKDVSLEEFEYKFNDCVKSRLISMYQSHLWLFNRFLLFSI